MPGGAPPHVLNLPGSASVQVAAAEFGRMDVRFNIAGGLHNGTVLPESDLELAFNLNICAEVLMIKAFLPAMLEPLPQKRTPSPNASMPSGKRGFGDGPSLAGNSRFKSESPVGFTEALRRISLTPPRVSVDSAVETDSPSISRSCWRRGRDSNPRWSCPHAAFRVRCIRPLCHLSAR